jgi:uncharacterized protein (DUF1330 family)
MSFIDPVPEQIKKLIASDYKGPIVMLNLLKFKPDGGKKSYRTYQEKTAALFLGKNIAGAVYQGDGLMPIIGDEEWDEIALYEYPSIQAFIDMATNEEYQKIIRYRRAALLDSRLYCTVPNSYM